MMNRGQQTLTSLFIVAFLLFMIVVPLNMLMSGVKETYGRYDAENFTFSNADNIKNTTDSMKTTLLNAENQDLGIVSMAMTVVNGAVNSLRLILQGAGSILSLVTDFAKISFINDAVPWLSSAMTALLTIVILFGVIAAYLRWRP